jgi:DNA polymerase-3 subunit epsilon
MFKNFLAIDFETANDNLNSACAVSIVTVCDLKITNIKTSLIKPPVCKFKFSYLHGITAKTVESALTFDNVWLTIKDYFNNRPVIAAHNAKFDRSVLNACCDYYKIKKPSSRFICSLQIAREVWNIYPTNLKNVCDVLGIQLDHHNPESDAVACAEILILAAKKKLV